MKAEYTIQECINGFNAHRGTHMESIFIRRMEVLSEWRTAAEYWKKIGYHSDAAACIMLEEAIEEGDRYREATKHLNDWVDETVDKGIMTKDEAIKAIYPEMNRIYNQHFSVTK